MEPALSPALITALIFLASAAVIVLLARRVQLSSVVGFLIAGLLFGPDGVMALLPRLGLPMIIEETDAVLSFAEIGVIFLLFSIGLELSPRRLWAMRQMVLGLGSAQILISAAAIGALALPWNHRPTEAVLIGLAFALSSTAMVMPLLIRSAQFLTAHGRAIFGVLLAQDVAVVPILLLVGTLGQSAAPSVSLGTAVLQAVAAVGGILVLGVAARPLFRAAARTGQRELFLAMAFLAVGSASLATEAAGLKAPLGAFMAGVILADTEFRHQLDVELEPLKGLLLGLFFFGVGLTLDVRLLFGLLPQIFLGLLGLMIVKAAIAFLLARAFGKTPAQSVRVAAGLAGAGEFVFVILGQAAKDMLIPVETMQYMQAVAGVSLMITPVTLALGDRLADRIKRRDPRPEPPQVQEEAKPVVIAGFGRVGRTIAAFLERFDIPYRAIDSNIQLVMEQKRLGRPITFGDASRPEMLEKLHLDEARVAVITVDDAAHAAAILKAVRALNPLLTTVVRAGHFRDVGPLRAQGGDHVVPDTIESSMALATEVCVEFDIPHESITPLIEQIRRTDYDLTTLTKPPAA